MGAMRARGTDAGGTRQVVDALRGIYATPWQMALQTWLEGVVPGERTFARPSRRGADRSDIVLPGRRRHAWMLNVVLDTSGSMSEEIPRALGAIADFCDAAAVDDIRLVQCDTEITADEVLTPAALAGYEVGGYGGSDLTPAMLALADDPRVTAAIVITDGDIAYPAEPMPYAVLWVLPPHGQPGFQPPYGRVVTMQPGLQPGERR
jgi:predicted metal-dependent peptidase